VNFLKGKGVEVGITASTGIAATHIGGMTIHSWAGIGINDEMSESDIRDLSKKKHLGGRFKRTKVLVIDEVSMLHHFRLDMVDKVCKMFKESAEPFGGMQVILVGDFFQLPPISRGSERAHFVHKSNIWNTMGLKVCYLDEQYRHEDDNLLNLLNDIRANNTGEHTLEPLRKRYNKNVDGVEAPTKLYTHNIDVDKINERELGKLPGNNKIFEMKGRGARALQDTLKRSCLAPEYLYLKKNAVVMFVKNNFEKGYVNGTLGKVVDFEFNEEYGEDLPVVETLNGERILAEPESWRIEEEGKTKAEIGQIPLRLAWAITVHKSQGMSLDAAEMDLSKAFVEGQGYVALSRVRTLSGLRLMGLNDTALRVNDEILEFDNELLRESKKAVKELKDLKDNKKKQEEFITSVTPTKEEKEEKLSTVEKTRLLLAEELTVEEIAKKREMTKGTIVGHIEKLREQGECPDITHVEKTIDKERLKKIKKAFEKSGDTKLSPVRSILGSNFTFDELRLARLFL
ncbi:MAG: helix-turn-helix domain-containing protein, partial [Parcubacteria group bacterium]|nr:helix-turn-helix domain-containing protein [Parcubacteria group bacterium]